jgi:uncharacterized protein (TIGR03067 family)
MNRAIAAFVIGLIAPALAAADDEATRRDLKALGGKWTTVRFEHKGRVAPADKAKATLTMEAGGKGVLRPEGGEVRFSFDIDPSKDPKQITLTYDEGPLKGVKQFGIYKLEGGKLTLCFAAPRAPEEERPKEFKTEGNDYTLIVHERADEAK